MFRTHYKNANSTLRPDKALINDTKAKMMEQVSDLEFASPSGSTDDVTHNEHTIRTHLLLHRASISKRNIAVICSLLLCILIITGITTFTNKFFNQTTRSVSSRTSIIAVKNDASPSSIDTSLWYGNYSGNQTSSFLTITKNDASSFHFSLDVADNTSSDHIDGTATILSHNSAEYRASDGFILYFMLSNGIVTVSKDPYCYNRHKVTFSGDYINIDGSNACFTSRYFNKLRSFGSDRLYRFDLNNDGMSDDINYNSGILTINKKNYNFNDESANLDTSCFHIIDINASDDYLNILIMDDGPSCDPLITIVTYTKAGKIMTTSIGSDISELTFDNAGKISGNFRLSLLQTWYGKCAWTFKDYTATFIKQDYYIPLEQETLTGDPICSTRKITLYQTDNKKSDTITLLPQQVKFIKTDNIHWVQVLGLKDHTEGWLYLTDYNEAPDEGTAADALFDNLIQAD